MKSVQAKVSGLKKDSSIKDKAIKVDEETILVLKVSVRQKDDFIAEISMRVVEAQDASNLAAERLLASSCQCLTRSPCLGMRSC